MVMLQDPGSLDVVDIKCSQYRMHESQQHSHCFRAHNRLLMLDQGRSWGMCMGSPPVVVELDTLSRIGEMGY